VTAPLELVPFLLSRVVSADWSVLLRVTEKLVVEVTSTLAVVRV
jgi:hypothetical protein